MKLRRLARISLLVALALILFVVEMALPAPVPVPGVKLGLANVITVWAVYNCTPAEALLVLVARVLLATLLSGNGAALIFSMTGGICGLVGALALKKVFPKRRMWLNSTCSGTLHNCGQLAAAIVITGTKDLLLYLPFLVVAGAICGALTGQIAQQLIGRLEKVFPRP